MIADQGQKNVRMMTEGCEARNMAFQVVDATRPLVSAGRITGKGQGIMVDDDTAHIPHMATGRKFKLHKK